MQSAALELLEKIKNEEDVFTKIKLIKHLTSEYQIPGIQIASYLEIKPSFLSNILRLENIPEIVKDGYYSKTVSLSHLILLSRMKDEEKIVELYEHILSESLNVASLEKIIRKELYKTETKGSHIKKSTEIEIISAIHSLDKNSSCEIIQSQVQAKIIIVLKGDRVKTTEFLEKLASKIV